MQYLAMFFQVLLEVVTSLSKACCIRLVQHDAIGILLNLVQSCNRSKPHMEILKHTVHILFHLSQYRETVHLSRDDESMEVMTGLLTSHRDVDDILLNLAKVFRAQFQYRDRQEVKPV
jgi:hypothetical protein